MRPFTLIILFLVVAALITVPGHKQFNKYLEKKHRNSGTCLGGTRHNSYKIFSLDFVDYCEEERMSATLITTGLKKIRTDRYLGLFGTFWRLPNN